MRYTAVTTILMSLSLNGKAQEQDESLIHFEIQPKICIAKEVGDTCAMKVKLQWQTNKPMNLCLAQNHAQLKCWQQESEVSEYIAIEVQRESEFTLQEQGSLKLFAKQKVKINYRVSKQYRRRLRSEWSIF